MSSNLTAPTIFYPAIILSFTSYIAMVEALKTKGYEMDFAFAEGTHGDNHGGSIMPEMLKWLWLDYKK